MGQVKGLADAHRHVGTLPAYAFYGGPPVNPDVSARSTVAALLADLDAEGTERALAEVFAFPSVKEGFGLAAMEAMAAGTPVAWPRS